MPTTLDYVFIGLAVFDLIFLVAMGIIGLQLMEKAKRGQESMQPALEKSSSLVDRGKTLALEVKNDAERVIAQVTDVAGKVKRRYETTKRIAMELKPAGEETVSAVQQTAAQVKETVTTVRETREDLSRKASTLSDMARRLGRVKSAAEAAAEAARKP
jgi:methyl-accepting chemotaxis protein